jgi:ribosomal protein S18 acetylase RimI-like enzyme
MKTLQNFILENQGSLTIDDIYVWEDPKNEGKYALIAFDKQSKKSLGSLEFTSELETMPVNDTVDKSKAIEIQSVEVKDKSRNNGVGTLLVKKCIEIADENESDIYLYAASLETVGNIENTEKLLKWYEKLGFEQVPDSEFDKNLGSVKKEQCLVRRYKK